MALSEDKKRMFEVDRACSRDDRYDVFGTVVLGDEVHAPSADLFQNQYFAHRLARCLGMLLPDTPVERIIEVVEASER